MEPSNFYVNQVVTALVGCGFVNLALHPLCTIKNRDMAGVTPFPLSQGKLIPNLYRGVGTMWSTEGASFVVTYVTNGFMKRNDIHPLISAIVAGAFASPVVAFGEGLMVNNQVNGKALSKDMLRSAMQGSGLFATMLREIPFSVSIFALSPFIGKQMPFSNEIANHAWAGFFSGGFCGAITAPADKIKTLVQAKNLPFKDAAGMVSREFTTAHGRQILMKNACLTAVYIGLAVSILNVINNQLPRFLPNLTVGKSTSDTLN